LHQEAHIEGAQAAPALPTPTPTHAAISSPSQPFSYMRQPRFQERPQVKIVRPSNRRKFLAGLVGGAAIVALGSTGIGPLVQNLRFAFNTRDYPYHLGDDLSPNGFSPDLNLMAMTRLSEGDSPDAKLYIWDYQRQHMTVLPTGPNYGDPACIWSPDNKSFVFQVDGSLDMWDMRTQQNVHSYSGDDYRDFSEIHWSFDGSQIAIRSSNDDSGTFAIMNPTQFTPVALFNVPKWALKFAWSPDGQKIAFLIDNPANSSWSIQIWIYRHVE
jgi:WD40 repeat protein